MLRQLSINCGYLDSFLHLFLHNLYIIIPNYLNNKASTVVRENSESTICAVVAGVPQAYLLVPVLFIVYVNYNNVAVSIYADDMNVIV
jgi:hypothetical protein